MSVSNRIRIKVERAIVTALIDELAKAGFVPRKVFDGGEMVPVASTEATLDTVFSVDESRIYFVRKGEVTNPQWVFLVGGNGEDIISDWLCGDKAFDAAVQRACDRVEKNLEVRA